MMFDRFKESFFLPFLLGLTLLLIFLGSPKTQAVTLSLNPDYDRGIMFFEANVTPMSVTQEPGVGEKDFMGYTYIGGGVWALERVSFFVTRGGEGGPIIWIWPMEMQVLGNQTTSTYRSYRFLLATKAPGDYTAQVTVLRAVRYGPPPALISIDYAKMGFTHDEDTYKPTVRSFTYEQAPDQNLVFKATATRFLGDPTDPDYGMPHWSDSNLRYRGNGIWVKQYVSFVVSRKIDGRTIWSSSQDPNVPIGINHETGEETYTSERFPTAYKNLSDLKATVTVYRLIKGYEGLIGWHAWLYSKEAFLDFIPDLITKLRVEPDEFDPYTPDGEARISYTLLQDAVITIRIEGPSDFEKSLFYQGTNYRDEKTQPQGNHTETWTGVVDFPELNGYLSPGDRGVFLATGGTFKITVSGYALDDPSITDSESIYVKVKTSW